jgi:hypothetical protein
MTTSRTQNIDDFLREENKKERKCGKQNDSVEDRTKDETRKRRKRKTA